MDELKQQRVLACGGLAFMGMAAAAASPPFRCLLAVPVVAACALAVLGVIRPGAGAAVAIIAAAISSLAATRLVWQAVMPLATLAFVAVATARPQLGSVRQPLGSVPVWVTMACAAVTPGALLLWLDLTRSDISDLVAMVPKVGVALLVLGGAIFAVLNAFFEEVIWRGVIQSRLLELFRARVAIGLQAASFGIAHAHGFPRGIVGVILAGSWAVMLGVLRQRSAGLLAPILAHVVADATIACIVVGYAR